MNFLQEIEAGVQKEVAKIETWVGEGYEFLKGKIAPAVVSAVGSLSQAEGSGILDAVASALSPVTSGLSVTVNNAIKAGLPTALAIGLGIEGLPDSPTASDVAAFEARIVAAVNKNAGLSGTWQTNVAAQIYGLIQSAIAGNGTLTFAQCVSLVEQSFQLISKAKTAAIAALAAPAPAAAA